MSDSWNDMKRAKEDQYFDKQNREALERLKKRESDETKPRLSPITGKAMVQETIHGVVIDRCPDSGGIFLDAGELEEIIKKAKEEGGGGWLNSFLGGLKS